jgi:hypothetical protein
MSTWRVSINLGGWGLARGEYCGITLKSGLAEADLQGRWNRGDTTESVLRETQVIRDAMLGKAYQKKAEEIASEASDEDYGSD